MRRRTRCSGKAFSEDLSVRASECFDSNEGVQCKSNAFALRPGLIDCLKLRILC